MYLKAIHKDKQFILFLLAFISNNLLLAGKYTHYSAFLFNNE